MPQASEEWMEIAAKELAESQNYDPDDVKIDEDGGFRGEGILVEMGREQWYVFESEEDAHDACVESIKDDLDSEPEIFNQDWLQNHIFITETDKRVLAGDEAEARIESMDDREIVEEAGREFEDEFDEAEDKDEDTDDIVENARDELRSKFQDEIEEELRDPVQYFVHDHGMYSIEDLMKAPFIGIDRDEAAEDAISADGLGHFLSSYDGEEVDLPSGAVAFRWN